MSTVTSSYGDSQVVPFPLAQDDAELVAVDPKPTTMLCLHLRIEYSVRERTVRCRQCNELLDPFDWLVGYAEREQRRQAVAKDFAERKRAAAERHAARRRARAAAQELAAPAPLAPDEARKRLAEMRSRLG